MDSGGPRLLQLVGGLRAALMRLDLAATRRQLALLELYAERDDLESRDAAEQARFYACACRAMFALTEGDLVGAATMTDQAERVAVGMDAAEFTAACRTLRNDRARQLRDREGMSTGAAACEEHARTTGSMAAQAEAAVLWLESGDLARAGAIVDRLAHRLDDLAGGDRPIVLARVCEAAVGTQRRVVARTCAELLRTLPDQGIVTAGATTFGGVVDDYVGLAVGDSELSARARSSYERLGAWWWARRRAVVTRPSTSLPRVLHLHPSHRTSGDMQWCIGAAGRTRLVTAMPGLDHIRTLLQHPHRDLTVADLTDTTGASDVRRRVIVRQAIAAALARIDMADPELAGELRGTLRTGLTCRYDPDPLQPTAWHLEVDVPHPVLGG